MTTTPPKQALPWRKEKRVLMALHVISIGMISLPNGVNWYFGNIVVYINSYWYIKLHTDNFLSRWVISANVIAYCVTLIAIGNLVRRINPRIITFLGIVVFNIGLFLSYFTIQYSQMAFIMTFGVLTGIGYGFMQTEILTRIPRMVSNRFGIIYAVVKSCFTAGAILCQWVATFYVNPENVEAKVSVTNAFQVFSDKSLIDRVPGSFILLGIITSFCHLIGFIMTVMLNEKGLGERPKTSETVSSPNDIKKEVVQETTALTISQKSNDHYVHANGERLESCSKGMPPSDKAMLVESYHEQRSPAFKGPKHTSDTCLGERDSELPVTTKDKTNGDDSKEVNIPPLEMIKTVTFYVLYFCMFANDVGYVILLNFYKMFGELWIYDDYFLTRLGMAFLITVLLFRLFWAMVMDKFGTKKTHIILSSSFALTSAFYYFSPGISRWLYSLLTCVMAGLSSAIYVIFSSMTLQFFGQGHFASNYGLVMSSTLVLNLIAPEVLAALLNNFGWSAVFLSGSVVNALALLAVVLGLRDLNQRLN